MTNSYSSQKIIEEKSKLELNASESKFDKLYK
jgi:hypothetical protein